MFHVASYMGTGDEEVQVVQLYNSVLHDVEKILKVEYRNAERIWICWTGMD